jgi:hypothetical protein
MILHYTLHFNDFFQICPITPILEGLQQDMIACQRASMHLISKFSVNGASSKERSAALYVWRQSVKAIKEGTPTKEKYVGTWNSPNIVPIYNLSLFVTCQLQSHFFCAVTGITI